MAELYFTAANSLETQASDPLTGIPYAVLRQVKFYGYDKPNIAFVQSKFAWNLMLDQRGRTTMDGIDPAAVMICRDLRFPETDKKNPGETYHALYYPQLNLLFKFTTNSLRIDGHPLAIEICLEKILKVDMEGWFFISQFPNVADDDTDGEEANEKPASFFVGSLDPMSQKEDFLAILTLAKKKLEEDNSRYRQRCLAAKEKMDKKDLQKSTDVVSEEVVISDDTTTEETFIPRVKSNIISEEEEVISDNSEDTFIPTVKSNIISEEESVISDNSEDTFIPTVKSKRKAKAKITTKAKKRKVKKQGSGSKMCKRNT